MKLENNSKKLDSSLVLKYSQEYGLPEEIVSSLLLKNYTQSEMESIVKDKELLDPFLIPSIDKVCDRILKAIKNQEKIFIFGDYDVDGTMAVTIFHRFLKEVGAKVSPYIPERSDGYGLSEEAVKDIFTKEGKVIITVDTGITAFDPALLAKDLNIDLIVTDHHNLHENGLPEVFAAINPKIEGTPEQIRNLSGAGVALYICRALNSFFVEQNLIEEEKNMVPYFSLAMISSIADVVSLRGENREIVKKGLKHIKKPGVIGLEQLVQNCNFFNHPTSSDIAFKISPILNAAGRLGQAEKTLDLLLTDDFRQAKYKSAYLISLNEDRKKLTEKYKPIALSKAKEQEENKVVVLAGDYPLGIIGILAAKVLEETGKPTIIISVKKGLGKASCRSIPAFNVKIAIDKTKDFHEGGGGHDVAAGFSIKESQIKEFVKEINKYAETIDFDVEETVFYDAEISWDKLKKDIYVDSLIKLEPFGKDNENPVFLIKEIDFEEGRVLNGGHLMLKTTEGHILFKFFPKQSEMDILNKKKISVIGEVSSNNKKLKVIIKEII